MNPLQTLISNIQFRTLQQQKKEVLGRCYGSGLEQAFTMAHGSEEFQKIIEEELERYQDSLTTVFPVLSMN